MAQKKDYFSFDEVLSDLQMEEDELKRLVSAGEIRAFRDKDTMKFKADDVNRLRGPDESVEEIDLGADLDLGDDLLEGDLDADDAVEEIDLAAEADDEPARPRRSGGGAPARAPRGARAAAAAAVEEESEGMGIRVALILLVVIMLIGSVVTFDAAGGRATNGVSDFVANLFKS